MSDPASMMANHTTTNPPAIHQARAGGAFLRTPNLH
jgi:hypothetical protein